MSTKLRARAATGPRIEQTPQAGHTPQPNCGTKRETHSGSRARPLLRWARTLADVLPDVVCWLLLLLTIFLMTC